MARRILQPVLPSIAKGVSTVPGGRHTAGSTNGHSQSHAGQSDTGGKAKTSPETLQSGVRNRSRSATLTGSKPSGNKASGISSRLENLANSAGHAVSVSNQATVGALQAHAVPAALIGAGLAWLLLETKTARKAEAIVLEEAKVAAGAVAEKLSDLGETAGEAYTQAASTTRETIGTVAGSVSRATSTAANAIRTTAETVVDYTKSGVGSAGELLRTSSEVIAATTQAGYKRSRQAVVNTWEQHPLVFGASLLVTGLGAGMFLPAPRRSGELLVRASEDISRKVGSKAAELLDKGREAVGLGSEARESGETTASTSNKKRQSRETVGRARRQA